MNCKKKKKNMIQLILKERKNMKNCINYLKRMIWKDSLKKCLDIFM